MSNYLDLDFLCLMICEHVYDEVDAVDKVCRGPVLNKKSFDTMRGESEPLEHIDLSHDGKRTYAEPLDFYRLEPYDVDQYYEKRPRRKNSLADLASLRLVTRTLCKVAASFLFRRVECNLTVSDVNNDFLPILRLDELSRSPAGQCIRTLHLSSLSKEWGWAKGPVLPEKTPQRGWKFRLSASGCWPVGAGNRDPKSRALSRDMLLLLQEIMKRLPLVQRLDVQGPPRVFDIHAIEAPNRNDTRSWKASCFFLRQLFDGMDAYPAELRMRLARRTGFELALPATDDRESAMRRLESLRYLNLHSTVEKYPGLHGPKKDLVDQSLCHKISNAKKLETLSLTFAYRFYLEPTTFASMHDLHTLHMHRIVTAVDLFASIVENCRVRSLSLTWVELKAGYWDTGLKELLRSTTLRRLSVWNCGYHPMGKPNDATRISRLRQPLRTKRQQDLDALDEVMRQANKSLTDEGVETTTYAGADHFPYPDPQFRALSCSDATWRSKNQPYRIVDRRARDDPELRFDD